MPSIGRDIFVTSDSRELLHDCACCCMTEVPGLSSFNSSRASAKLPEYIKALSSNEPEAPRIQAPFQLEPLKHLLSTARECLDNNFFSSFLTLVGSIMAFHYTSILVTQDECPLILCYSRESGTGKSTSLQNALSVFGMESSTNGPETNPAAVVDQAAITTLPLGVDDIKSAKRLFYPPRESPSPALPTLNPTLNPTLK